MMQNCRLEVSQNLQHIILNSGRDIFRKGHYEQCLNQQNFKYSLVKFGLNKVDIGSFIGLCVPKACPDSEISTIVDSLLNQLHQPLKVLLVDSQTNQSSYQTSWMTYFVIALILVVLMMVVWATLVEQTPRMVKAFDFKRNLEHFNIRANQDLNILDGLRAICTLWMVFSHFFSFNFAVGPANMKTIHDRIDNPFFLLLEEGLIAVDVFFMMSGFLLAYIFLKKHTNSLLVYPLAIIQRVLRIWPAFFFTITFYAFVFIHLSKGPVWSLINAYVSNCSHIWQSFFFVSNLLYDGDKICMAWSWYLQAEIQIFIVCMFLLFLYNKNKPFAYLLIAFMIVASVVSLFITSEENGFQIYWNETTFADMMRFIQGAYMKPWSRSSSYFIGLIFGLKFYEYKCRNDQNEGNILHLIKDRFTGSRRSRSLCQMIGFLIILSVIIFPQLVQLGITFSQQFYSIYTALSRPVFIFGVIVLILPTVLGFAQTSFVNFLLTPKIFHFISRISFCTYLVHLMVMYQFLYTNSYDYYFIFNNVFVTYLGILIISLFFGFCLTMAVEVPFANLQKMMFDSFSRKKENLQQRKSLIDVQDRIFSPKSSTSQSK